MIRKRELNKKYHFGGYFSMIRKHCQCPENEEIFDNASPFPRTMLMILFLNRIINVEVKHEVKLLNEALKIY